MHYGQLHKGIDCSIRISLHFSGHLLLHRAYPGIWWCRGIFSGMYESRIDCYCIDFDIQGKVFQGKVFGILTVKKSLQMVFFGNPCVSGDCSLTVQASLLGYADEEHYKCVRESIFVRAVSVTLAAFSINSVSSHSPYLPI